MSTKNEQLLYCFSGVSQDTGYYPNIFIKPGKEFMYIADIVVYLKGPSHQIRFALKLRVQGWTSNKIVDLPLIFIGPQSS